MSNFFISKKLSNFLNLLRWLSAFLVVIGHLRSITFLDISQTKIDSILWKLFYFFTGFGHQAVIVFFVLSGFLVSGSMLKRLKTNKLSIKNYMIIDRGVRIYIVLIPALLLTLFLDSISIEFFNNSGIYTNQIHFSSLNYNILERLNLETFLGNIAMLQESYFTTFGSNSPLWSLAYEVWYYIFFFIILTFINTKDISFKLIFIILFFIIIFILNEKIILYFSIWLLGVAIWFINIKIPKIITYLVSISFILSLLISRLHIFSEFLIDFIFAISTTGLILIIKNNNQSIFNFGIKINENLSQFSYTLYLIHFPILLFLISLANSLFHFQIQDNPSFLRLLFFIFLIMIIYIFSYFFAKNTEFKTKYIQQRILNEN